METKSAIYMGESLEDCQLHVNSPKELVGHIFFFQGGDICFLPPGKAPLSQRTASIPARSSPPPRIWHPGLPPPAGRGHSCGRPTRSRWGSRWSAALRSTPCSPGQTGHTSERHARHSVSYSGSAAASNKTQSCIIFHSFANGTFGANSSLWLWTDTMPPSQMRAISNTNCSTFQ